MNIKIISASAGTGKTHALVETIYGKLSDHKSGVRADGIIATTFTSKAATELKDRIRKKLFSEKKFEEASLMELSLIGTVHGICQSLIQRYAIEAGISPRLMVIAENEQNILFGEALSRTLRTKSDDTERLQRIDEGFGRELYQNEHNKQDSWEDTVRKIVDAARANGIPARGIMESGESSAESYLKLFLTPSNQKKIHLDDLLPVINSAIQSLENAVNSGDDSTKATAGFLETLKQFRYRWDQNQNMPWNEWEKISRGGVAKKSQPLLEDFMKMIPLYRFSEEIREDVSWYIQTVFQIAAQALEDYSQYKKERGLIDFNDMEAIALELLGRKNVQKDIGEKYDLLIVDEFQDTNPMQLALFIRLGEHIKECIWVGDPKQTIYDFRGSDPELMDAVLSHLPGNSQILDTSYRSLPGVIQANNIIFESVFAGYFPSEKIRVKSERKSEKDHPFAVNILYMDGKNAGTRTNSLASAVIELLGEKITITERSGKKRPLRGSDLAIFCRSNKACRGLSDALAERGISSTVRRKGLYNTAEVRACVSALQLWVNKTDMLARSELILLLKDFSPEKLLDDRLVFLKEKKDDTADSWLSGEPEIKSILDASEKFKSFTPLEALDTVMDLLDLRRSMQGRTDSELRMSNLETLRRIAVEYEDTCRQMNSGASIAGFILHLKDLSSRALDEMGENTSPDAVEICTYHGAKGLEWPITILSDLDFDAGVWPFQVSVLPNRDAFSVRDPLQGRSIRFFPWIHGSLKKIEWLEGGVLSMPDYASMEKENLSREKRLFYVGQTRARDRIYWACGLDKNEKPQINTIYKLFKNHPFEITEGENSSAISIDGNDFPAAVMRSTENETRFEPKISGIYFDRPQTKNTYRKAYIAPSGEDHPSSHRASVLQIIDYSERLPIKGHPEMDRAGNCFHAFLASYKNCMPEKRKDICENLIRDYDLMAHVDAVRVLEQADKYFKLIDEKIPHSRCLTEVPFTSWADLQLVTGYCDMLLESEKGWALIDHKSFPGSIEDHKSLAVEYSSQLAWYGDALESSNAGKVSSYWINFFTLGKMVELKFDEL